MYALIHYELVSTTPVSMLSKKEMRALSIAINAAEKSAFSSSHRLGACFEKGGQCILCR